MLVIESVMFSHKIAITSAWDRCLSIVLKQSFYVVATDEQW